MSEVKKPVFTDETGRGMKEAMQFSNAVQRERRDLLAEQNGILERIYEKIGNAGAATTAPELYFVDAAYDGSSYTLTSAMDDISAAYDAGKYLILRIAHNDQSYYNPLTSYQLMGNGNKVYRFFSAGMNPESFYGAFMVAMGKVVTAVFDAGPKAEVVDCSVMIGGTEYTNVADALTALAALHGS